MHIDWIYCFITFLCLNMCFGRYIIYNEFATFLTPTEWMDKMTGQALDICQKNSNTYVLGKQQSLTNIYWQKIYSLPATTRLDIYIEFLISGIWNNQKLEVYANNILMQSISITLNDQNRDCKTKQQFSTYQSFLYESKMYLTFKSNINTLQLTFKSYAINQGLYVQNIVINQKTEYGRDYIIPFFNYLKTCTQGSGLEFIQYYCQCTNSKVFQNNKCQSQCDQNYLYDPQTNECYYKSNCQTCSGKNTILQCSDGMFKYQETTASISNCVQKCPQDYYADQTTMTCINMQMYLQLNENKGSIYYVQLDIVDHYFFYKSTADFFHFFQYNDFVIQVKSNPTKFKERSFVYRDGNFVIGSYETFQSQTIQLFVILKNSQYKLRFRAIGHFIDFHPTTNDVIINEIPQSPSSVILSTNNINKNDPDYIAYYDYFWTRKELHPLTYNTISFFIEQPLQNGVYQGYFYLEDIHIFPFRCVAGCKSCYNADYCTPCLNPANKNPSDCTCLTGYVMKQDICIGCPTYCTYCTVEGICDDCQIITKRLNPPSCNICPQQYYIKIDQDICQQCIIGCKICNNNTQCINCLQGYYKNIDQQCIIQCIDGYFNDNTDLNNPICSLCSINCLKCQNTATYCIACTEYATLINNQCYSCSDGYYLSNTSCLPCISNCQQCQGLICLKCQESYFFQPNTGQCVSICESNYYSQISTRTCEICDSSCLTCLNNTANDCVSCPQGKILNLQNTINGICQQNCLAGYFRISDQCFKCWKGCSQCIDTSQACLTCAQRYYRHKLNDLCYEQCPDGYYNNKIGFVCSICDQMCKTCNGAKDINCTTCTLPLGYFQNQCIKKCPEGYGNVNAVCLQCTPNCQQCFGIAPNQCAVCSQGFFFLKNQCYFKCPTSFVGVRPQYMCKCIYDNCVACTTEQFFYNNHCFDVCPQGSFGFNGLCIQCSLACETCFGEDEQSCLSCSNPLILFQTSCVTECTGMTFHDLPKNECLYCDISCLACNGPNKNNCTVCEETKFLTVEGTCVDECSSNEYAVLMEKKCYKCDSSCQTCFSGSKNSCLTCNNLFYLYQCVDNCPDGFTISDNKLSCEPNFSIVITQCAYQCQTCELIARFCKTCSGNRAPNPPNCDCENGYFDDGQNSNCLPCLNKCSTCSHSPDACITCKGNRVLPKCNCPRFYYDDGFSVDCQRCQDNCATCTALQCITCLNNRIKPPDCICPDGYYEEYKPYCMQCAQKCLKCSMSEELCITCSTIRLNPPICNCPLGYFENSDEECEKCNPGCIECDISGCLTCFGNRIGPIKGQCICQNPGVSRLSVGSIYCTDCSLGVPYFGLNDQFNGFYYDFGAQIKIMTDETTDLCNLIFEKDTLDKLGSHPQCSNDFNVLFGNNPNIQVGDMLNMKPQFLLYGCNDQFENVLGMPLSIPQKIDPSSHKPILKFKELISPSVCAQITIEFSEKLYNGNQQLKVLSWDILLPKSPETEIQGILQSNVANSSEVIIFPMKTFQPKTLYKFAVTVESFAHLKNTITIEFIPQAYSTIIFKANSTINQFHRYENIIIPFSISYYNCIEAIPPPQNLYYSISLKNTTLIKGQVTEGLHDGDSIDLQLEFPPFYFSQYNSQTLVLTTKLIRADYSAKTNDEFIIYIISSIPTLSIEGGNRMIGYDTNLKLNATIKDPDLTEKEAEKNNQNCNWQCTDIINGTNCQNQFHENIEFDQNCSQFIKSKTFAPYEVFIFTVTINKNLLPYSTRITIQTVEIDLPILNVIGANEQQELNYYDEVIYQMIYPGINPDLLMYAGAVIYNSEAVATFQLFYLDIKFKLQNYFTNLTQQFGNKARLRLSVYDPRFILPSINTQILFMNIPPQECELNYIDKPDFVEFLDNLNITVINCQDDNLPLLYSVQLYPNETIYRQDLIQSNFYHYLSIIPPQQSNNLIFTLPYLNYVQHLLLILIEDSKGGIFNITTLIKVRQYENINKDTFLNYLNKQTNLNQQLIGYRIIAERLQNIQNEYGFQDRLFNELLQLDQNQSLLSNQTESLYHSISILAGQNISMFQTYDNILLINLNIRIQFAQKMIENYRKEQENHQLSSSNNIQRNYYLQQYDTFANILSSLIKYRVQQNKSAIDIQDNLTQIITILQNNSIPNEPLKIISTDSVNLNFGYLTSKLTESVTGGSISDNKKLDDQFGDNLDYNSSTKYYKYSQTRYLDNPYYTTSGFPQNSTGYQAVDPKIVEQNQSSDQSLSQPMTFAFPSIKELAKNTSIECIAQVDSSHWSAGICNTKQIKDQIICECKNLNPTSVMESLDYIMDKVNEIYSLDTLLAFASFPFYKTFIFYFYLFITGSYLSAIYWGMKVDEKMYQQIRNSVEIISDEIAQTEKGNHSNGDAQNAPQVEIIFKRTIFKSINTKIANFLNYQKEQKNIGSNQQGKQSIENSAREIISVRGQIQSVFVTSPKIFIGNDQQVKDQSLESKTQSPNDIQNRNLPKISKLKAYFEYLKFFHQILQVFYKDDEQKPRALRATIVYTSIMGSLTVLFVFNQPGNLSLTITLALITAPLNKIYQIILEKLLTHQKKVVRSFGGLSIIIFVGMISYTMLAGLMLSGSVDAANQWSIIFISQFSLDNLLYSPMQLVLQYCVHIGLINFPKLQQLLHKFLDEKGKQFLKEIFTKTGLV